MRRQFDQQLALLNRELIEMGALCEEVIALASKALTEGDPALAARVAPLDTEIDQKERTIESLCLKLLLQQQPVARDLRQISAALKMITDMERILKTADTFRVKTAVCVNKADTNAAKTEEIFAFCRERKIPFTGTIPFDKEAVKAINSAKSIAELDCPSGRAVREVYEVAMVLLFEEANCDDH